MRLHSRVQPETHDWVVKPDDGSVPSKSRATKVRRFQPLVDIPLLLALASFLIPIVWMMVLAFQPGRNIISPDWRFGITVSNFADLLDPSGAFPSQFLNSVLIVLGTVPLCLGIGAAAGYAISRLDLPNRVTFSLAAVGAVLVFVPPMALVPGLYVALNNLGLLGTVQGLILANTLFNAPFAVLLMKAYFDTVPASLREAAFMDGASELRAFLQVMLPLVRPGVGAVCVFVGIMTWNEFLLGLTMTSGGRSAPVTVGIAGLVQPYQIVWGQMAAAGTLAALPIILAAVLANRQIVSGLTGGVYK